MLYAIHAYAYLETDIKSDSIYQCAYTQRTIVPNFIQIQQTLRLFLTRVTPTRTRTSRTRCNEMRSQKMIWEWGRLLKQKVNAVVVIRKYINRIYIITTYSTKKIKNKKYYKNVYYMYIICITICMYVYMYTIHIKNTDEQRTKVVC